MTAGLRILSPLAWRNLWRNPRRTVITLIVVAVGMWSVLVFNAFLVAWSQAGKDEALGLLIGHGQIHAKGYMDDPSIETLMPPPPQALSRVLDGPLFAAWAARLSLPGVVQSEYKTLPATLTGVDPAAEARLSSIPGRIIEGRYLADSSDEGVVLGRNLAKRLNTGTGRRVILMTQDARGALAEQSFTVIGLFDADQPTEDFYVFTGISALGDMTGLKDEVAEIVFTLENEDDLATALAALERVAPDLDIRSWKQLSLFLAATDGFMQSFILIWLGVVFTLMAIGIVNTQLMAVFERIREFGLLQALGLRPRAILTLVALESALLIGCGVVIGMAVAALTITAASGGIDLTAFAAAMEMFQGGQVLYPALDPRSFLLLSLTIWILGILVALWPARRASKASPVEAMRRDT